MSAANRISKLKGLIVAVGLVVLLSTLSAAQDARGQFTLSAPVHWGMATLPKGDYIYSVSIAGPVTMVRLQDVAQKQSFFVLPQAKDSSDPNTSKLVMERAGQETFVRALYVGGLGQVLYFSAPRQRPMIARSVATPKDSAAPSGNTP